MSNGTDSPNGIESFNSFEFAAINRRLARFFPFEMDSFGLTSRICMDSIQHQFQLIDLMQ